MAAEKAPGDRLADDGLERVEPHRHAVDARTGQGALPRQGRRAAKVTSSIPPLTFPTVCGIVLLRQVIERSGQRLTEAQVVRRFARLGEDLTALYAAYYVAELLADWTEELDPHPALFDQAARHAWATCGNLPAGRPDRTCRSRRCDSRWFFSARWGIGPVLDRCATCQRGATGAAAPAFSARGRGILVPGVPHRRHRECGRELSVEALAEASEPMLTIGRARWRGTEGAWT